MISHRPFTVIQGGLLSDNSQMRAIEPKPQIDSHLLDTEARCSEAIIDLNYSKTILNVLEHDVRHLFFHPKDKMRQACNSTADDMKIIIGKIENVIELLREGSPIS